MDSHEWFENENKLAFAKHRAVLGFLQIAFRGDSTVHVGMIYLAIGSQAGTKTSHFILFMPYYNPLSHGYNFAINQPYIFARCFTGIASSDFFHWIDSEFIITLSEDSSLINCSPVLLAECPDMVSPAFNLLKWCTSEKDENTMVIKKDTILECWIHDARNSKSMETNILNDFKRDQDLNIEFKKLLSSENFGNITNFIDNLSTKINSFSFPTIQIDIVSPMDGLVPFSCQSVRVKIGGVIESSDRMENNVHIPVSREGYQKKRIKFQRLWDILIQSIPQEEIQSTIKVIRSNVFRDLADI